MEGVFFYSFTFQNKEYFGIGLAELIRLELFCKAVFQIKNPMNIIRAFYLLIFSSMKTSLFFRLMF